MDSYLGLGSVSLQNRVGAIQVRVYRDRLKMACAYEIVMNLSEVFDAEDGVRC